MPINSNLSCTDLHVAFRSQAWWLLEDKKKLLSDLGHHSKITLIRCKSRLLKVERANGKISDYVFKMYTNLKYWIPSQSLEKAPKKMKRNEPKRSKMPETQVVREWKISNQHHVIDCLLWNKKRNVSYILALQCKTV